jgi:Ohr subfamily peroxiredoxin
MSQKKVIYEAVATTTGGRRGHTRTSDGRLDLQLDRPAEMGGEGQGSNPEQLFACGYSACFGGTIDFLASQKQLKLTRSEVTANVGLVADPQTGYSLKVAIRVKLEGIPRDTAKELVEMAHRNCPYSKATRGDVDVSVELQ